MGWVWCWAVSAGLRWANLLVSTPLLLLPIAAEDFQLLGWQGSLERPPRLLLTLCKGAEPGGQQGGSPLSPGSRGRSPMEVDFGVLGRDGARVAVSFSCARDRPRSLRLRLVLMLSVGNLLRLCQLATVAACNVSFLSPLPCCHRAPALRAC